MFLQKENIKKRYIITFYLLETLTDHKVLSRLRATFGSLFLHHACLPALLQRGHRWHVLSLCGSYLLAERGIHRHTASSPFTSSCPIWFQPPCLFKPAPSASEWHLKNTHIDRKRPQNRDIEWTVRKSWFQRKEAMWFKTNFLFEFWFWSNAPSLR